MQVRGTWDESGNGGHSVPPETGVQGDTGALTGSGSKAPRCGDRWVEPAETDLEAQVGVQCRGHCTARQSKGRRKAGGAQPRPPEGSSGRKEAGGNVAGSSPTCCKLSSPNKTNRQY